MARDCEGKEHPGRLSSESSKRNRDVDARKTSGSSTSSSSAARRRGGREFVDHLRRRLARAFHAALARRSEVQPDQDRHPVPPGHVHQLRGSGRRARRGRENEGREDAIQRRHRQRRLLDRQAARQRPHQHVLLHREQADGRSHGAVEASPLGQGGHYAQVVPRFVPLMFNLCSDPFESYDSKDSYSHLFQKSSWVSGPMGEVTGGTCARWASTRRFRLKSFDRSNLVQDSCSRGGCTGP